LRIGRVAADFLTIACAGRHVTLSRAARRGGSPTVPARWLTRLSTFLRGQAKGHSSGLSLPLSHAPAWAAALDRPEGGARPAERPAFAPPAEARPHRLTISDVGTLIADPYAFYAQRILRLRVLDPLEQEPGAADYGNLVHAAIHRFLGALPPTWPGEAEAARLWDDAALVAEDDAQLRPAMAAMWRPRLARIGGFVRGLEAARRPGQLGARAEIRARWPLRRPGGTVILEGRADRLDILPSGALRLVDYKTGAPPSAKDVGAGNAPQLPREALLAQEGAFEGVAAGPVEALEYWKLTGALDPGEVRRLDLDLPAVVEEARRAVEGLADRFLFGRAPFLARPHPGRAAKADYAHLARIAEWSTQ
ncbi:MAG TPA: PD-(D/E)XK nuclease family protein, partial [Roseococcus sp.]|nr:PD-(D/E)XK nuclease family protein [Roseococcus sp.]